MLLNLIDCLKVDFFLFLDSSTSPHPELSLIGGVRLSNRNQQSPFLVILLLLLFFSLFD